MWNAKLISVDRDLSKTIEGLSMVIEFSDGEHTSNKTYKIWLDEMTEVNLLAIKAIVQEDLDRLAKMDTLFTNLTSKIGTVL